MKNHAFLAMAIPMVNEAAPPTRIHGLGSALNRFNVPNITNTIPITAKKTPMPFTISSKSTIIQSIFYYRISRSYTDNLNSKYNRAQIMNEIDYSIPQGRKDIEIYDLSKQITLEFIDELNQKGFLKKHITMEEDTLTEKVTNRVNDEATSIAKLERLFHDNKFQAFFDDVLKHEILQKDVMNFYMGLFAHQLLDVFELFKKYFVVVLDKEKLKLRGSPTLGTIFNQIEKKQVKHRFNEIIDVELRNALGHGWYWWQNNEFYYTVDPTLKRTKKLALDELFVVVRRVSLLTRAFTDNAFERILEIKRNDK